MASAPSSDPKPTGEPVIGYPAANSAPPPSFAVAYSYPAPPYVAPNPHNASSRGYSDRDPPSLLHALYRRILIAVIVAFLLIGATTFLLWLILRPRIPIVSISSAAVSGFNLSSPSAADPRISSSFDIALSVSNPNHRMDISYGEVAAAVGYGGYILADTSLPPFYQERESSTTLRTTMVAAQKLVASSVSTGISDDRANGNAVEFQVMVEAWVWLRRNWWRTSRSLIRVYCGNIRIAFANQTAPLGSMVEPSKRCDVNLG